MEKKIAIETQELTRLFKRVKPRSLRKRSKKAEGEPVVALDQVNLKIYEGELFGLLGPNGAGKTTLIKILTTLLLPTSGKAFIDGIDVEKEPQKIRPRINMVSGGEESGYGILTVRETLWMFSQFYGIPGKIARQRIDRLLGVVGLMDEATTKVYKLSTGMRQKMNFARGFVSDPKIIFLDEPTLGLDVEAARDSRKFIKTWLSENSGRTVLLTTHYMIEAEELCDRIAIINHGKIIACDTPDNLKLMVQKEPIFHLETSLVHNKLDEFRRIQGVIESTYQHNTEKNITSFRLRLEEEGVITKIIDILTKNGSKIISLDKSEPSLEDVFVKLVGRKIEEEDES